MEVESQLLAALEQAWNAGGQPEMAYFFIDGEWKLVTRVTRDNDNSWRPEEDET